jgi:hypothetical protein
MSKDINRGCGHLVENLKSTMPMNKSKHKMVTKGGSLGSTNLTLGNYSKHRVVAPTFENMNYDKLKPIGKGKGLKRNNIKLAS